MPLRRRLALYGTGIAAIGMFVFIVLLSGLGTNGVRGDQDRNLTAIADAAATALEKGDASFAAQRPLVVTDLRVSAETFLLVLAFDGTVRYASGLLDGAPPRVPAAVIVEASEQGHSIATISAGADVKPGAEPSAFRVVARKWARGNDGGLVLQSKGGDETGGHGGAVGRPVVLLEPANLSAAVTDRRRQLELGQAGAAPQVFQQLTKGCELVQTDGD